MLPAVPGKRQNMTSGHREKCRRWQLLGSEGPRGGRTSRGPRPPLRSESSGSGRTGKAVPTQGHGRGGPAGAGKSQAGAEATASRARGYLKTTSTSQLHRGHCVVIEAGVTRSTVRIWPPTQGFQFSPRHLFAEQTSATAAPCGGGARGRWEPAGRGPSHPMASARPPLQEQGALSLWPRRGRLAL